MPADQNVATEIDNKVDEAGGLLSEGSNSKHRFSSSTDLCPSSKVPNGASQLSDIVLTLDGVDKSPVPADSGAGIGHGLHAINGSIISFRDLGYTVSVRSRSHCCSCRKETLHVLQNARSVWEDSSAFGR